MAQLAGTVSDLGSVQSSYVRINKGYVYLLSAIAALGGILFGFDLVIISGTVGFFQAHFGLNELETGWAVGCINLGAAIGAIMGGWLCERIGRKKLLMICAILFAVTGGGTGWAENFPMFIGFRMLSGVAVGAAALVCPIYLAEISPAPMRGTTVSFYQLSIVVGILLAYLSNYLLLDAEDNWRWMFSSQSIPALLFYFSLFGASESPRWLIRIGREFEAHIVLERVGGLDYALAEQEQIEQSFAKNPDSRLSDLARKDIWHIVFIGIMIAVFSQIVGQNSIFSYAPELFKKSGTAQNSAFLQSIIIGVTNFVFTFIAIGTIDRLGRKKLLQYGSFLLFADAIALAMAFYFQWSGGLVLFFVLGFIGVYSATLGPATWVVLAEIFPNRIRGNAMAVATLALWIANFFTTALFPVMNQYFGVPVTFLTHAAICLGYYFFIRTSVPETKGKSLEEIEKLLQKS
jgi:SP family arabinose:H+ symporter-like MFS transporter